MMIEDGDFFSRTESYRPKGGWCKLCLGQLADCGDEGGIFVGRIRRLGRVHLFRTGFGFTHDRRITASYSYCLRVHVDNIYYL